VQIAEKIQEDEKAAEYYENASNLYKSIGDEKEAEGLRTRSESLSKIRAAT
jgi:hypothetical protein